MNSPTVSVIVPNYNHAAYLRQRLDSILQQTYQHVEVILLDDCSTDSSREILREYVTHPRISHILLNEVNSGSPFLQWQKGIALATGEWIWIAESDDYADRTFLEKMMEAVHRTSGIGLVYCDSCIVTDQGVSGETFASLKNRQFSTSRWSTRYLEKGTTEIEAYLLPGGTINNTSAVLFNRQVLLAAEAFDLNLRYIGDKYAFVKVLAISDVAYVAEALNFFRDPFNLKHADRYLYYFFEQFLVFDWVARHLEITNPKKFMKGFYANTRNSLFRGWNKEKWMVYQKLFQMNPKLLLASVWHNLLAPFQRRTA